MDRYDIETLTDQLSRVNELRARMTDSERFRYDTALKRAYNDLEAVLEDMYNREYAEYEAKLEAEAYRHEMMLEDLERQETVYFTAEGEPVY